MSINNSSEFITQIIEDSVHSNTLVYKDPTRDALVKIVKWLEKLGYETRWKSKEAVLYLVEDLIRNSQGLSNQSKKNAKELVTLFINAYPGLYEKSINEKNKKLQTEIETNNFQKQEILQNGWWNQEEIIKSKEAATSENIDDLTRSEIEAYSNANRYCLQWEKLQKLKWLKYSRTTNSNGIIQHMIGDIHCTSMISEQYPYGAFTYKDLNNNVNDYSQWRDWDNLNKNYEYNNMLQLSGAVHQSFEQQNTMIFGIMQQIVDQLWLWVKIDLNFVDSDSSKNDDITDIIMRWMRSIFGTKFVIPYKIDNRTGLVSILDWSGIHCWVYRNLDNVSEGLASLSAIVSPLHNTPHS